MDDRIKSAVDWLKEKGFDAEYGIILGSGLGGMIDSYEKKVEVPYSEIPGFMKSSVPGHEGKLVQVTISGVDIIVMSGRFHYYEGFRQEELRIPVFVLHGLGVGRLIVTNAVGAMTTEFNVGDFMLIRDHLNWSGPNPLFGIRETGERSRFVDMSKAYSPFLRRIAKRVKPKKMTLREGVLTAFSGPAYETPSEVAAARILGGDVASMSTVPEVLSARYLGIEVLALSCITNHAAGVGTEPGHEEVLRASRSSAHLLSDFIEAFLAAMGEGK